MRTTAVVMWVTLYYAYHDVHTIIPKHGHNLLYFKRFIDDFFGIWTENPTSDEGSFSKDIDNFGFLMWGITDIKPATSDTARWVF